MKESQLQSHPVSKGEERKKEEKKQERKQRQRSTYTNNPFATAFGNKN
jgi:hypothetical protein